MKMWTSTGGLTALSRLLTPTVAVAVTGGEVVEEKAAAEAITTWEALLPEEESSVWT